MPFDRHYGNGLALKLALDMENDVALPSGLHYGNGPSLKHYRLRGIVMDESARMLLITIGSSLLVLGTTALVGLIVARHLDSKNERSGPDDPPGPPRQHL